MPRRKRMLSLQNHHLELRSSLLRLGRLIKIVNDISKKSTFLEKESTTSV